MIIDFNIRTYKLLLAALQSQGSVFQTFAEFIREPKIKAIILRHDVDKLPENSMHFAKIQAEMGIKSTYYFRAVAKSWDEDIIKEIAALGHEVGYHYETMDTAFSAKMWHPIGSRKENNEKLIGLAYEEFCLNLAKLRKLVPVSTVCMHGSPRSRFNNKDIWKIFWI